MTAAGSPAPDPQPSPPADDRPPRTGDPPGAQWPDSLGFWLVTTFVVIAVPAILCAGGYSVLRKMW